MAVLKLQRLPQFLRSGDRAIRVFLVHGPDAGRVRETSRAIVIAHAGSEEDPFTVARLDEGAIAADAGRLADEVNALAFGGGIRTVWLREAGATTARALASLLDRGLIAGVIVVEAGPLANTSALRGLIEKSPLGMAIACYEDQPEDLRSVVTGMLKSYGLESDDGALEFLVARLGGDRALARSEIDKLITYCHGRSVVGLDDVEAVCSDGQTGTVDRLIDQTMEGRGEDVLRTMDELSEAGASPAALLTSLAGHISRLRGLQGIAAETGPEAALRSARPPVFFKRHASCLRQLRLWPTERLDAAADTVFEAVLQTRRFPQLDRPIAERALLAISLRASRHRAASAP